MTIKNLFYCLFLLSLALGCSEEEVANTPENYTPPREELPEPSVPPGNWIKSSFFSGIPRNGQISFTIGKVGYVGFGENIEAKSNDDDHNSDRFGDYITEDGVFSDLWKFEEGTWTQLASLMQVQEADSENMEAANENKNVARTNAVAFAANGKGYVGTGQIYNGGWQQTSDFWSYNPITDSWERIPDFPGGKRTNAFAFSIGDYGYVGCGYNNRTMNDFYRFNTKTKEWDEISYSFYGEKREGAQTFVIGDFAYVISGRNNNVDLSDVWKFDPSKLGTSEAWEKQIDLDDYDFNFRNVRRSFGTAWACNGLGYVATGICDDYTLNDVWEFDPSTQEWTQKQDFEGEPRQNAAAFVLDGVAYVGGGVKIDKYYDDSNIAYDDFYRFDPTAEYNSKD